MIVTSYLNPVLQAGCRISLGTNPWKDAEPLQAARSRLVSLVGSAGLSRGTVARWLGDSRAGLVVDQLAEPSRLKTLVHHAEPWLLLPVGFAALLEKRGGAFRYVPLCHGWYLLK